MIFLVSLVSISYTLDGCFSSTMSNVILNDINTKSLRQWLNLDSNILNIRDTSILDNVLVNDSRVPSVSRYNNLNVNMTINELIDHVHYRLFTESSGKPSNILTLGYRMANVNYDRVKLDSLRVGISNYYINTNVRWFLTTVWKDLHSQ